MPRTDFFHGLFPMLAPGQPRSTLRKDRPATVPDPVTGRPLHVAAVEVADRGICPSCAQLGAGAYVSFVSDLRLAFACPNCRQLVFTPGL